MNHLIALFDKFKHISSCLPDSYLSLLARLAIAGIFWQSAQTKVEGWAISDSAYYLFEHEYNLPLISPVVAAILATLAEHIFSLCLALGLATRLSALSLLAMTLVIQIFVYPDAWPTHGTWAVCLLFLVSRGGGKFSLDHLVLKFLK